MAIKILKFIQDNHINLFWIIVCIFCLFKITEKVIKFILILFLIICFLKIMNDIGLFPISSLFH